MDIIIEYKDLIIHCTDIRDNKDRTMFNVFNKDSYIFYIFKKYQRLEYQYKLEDGTVVYKLVDKK